MDGLGNPTREETCVAEALVSGPQNDSTAKASTVAPLGESISLVKPAFPSQPVQKRGVGFILHRDVCLQPVKRPDPDGELPLRKRRELAVWLQAQVR